MMNCLDRNGLHGYYLVMDNAPPYSPIEEFWSKVKAGIKRNPLDSSDLLTPRIMDFVTKVTLKNDCRGRIKHSVFFFPRQKRFWKN
ncbi:hypothetical protein BDF21DRAFT_433290 [Thamnidium elegans]|nr:hypothetical protein BDF21DRAFT_433290 [Thamnidium elegans]